MVGLNNIDSGAVLYDDRSFFDQDFKEKKEKVLENMPICSRLFFRVTFSRMRYPSSVQPPGRTDRGS
jgi:hypothetical protein